MNIDYFSGRVLATAFCLAFLIVSSAAVVGQDVKPRVAAGTGVSVATQRALGLVTVNGGCSGTLLNQYWVLTARHCVTVQNVLVGGTLTPADQVRVTATWAAKTGIGSRIHDFNINSAPGSARNRDIVLVYLGSTNLGEAVVNQRRFTVIRDGKLSGRLTTTDVVTQYGIGFSTFATDLMTPSNGLGTYRSAVFNPSEISATHYDLNMNAGNQSGHGGDSGGPSVVTIYGKPDGGIAGVQSTCKETGYISGAPAQSWSWATGIRFCTYVSTEPFLNEISEAIKEAPLKTPYITSALSVTPFLPYNSIILAWDGGPDYPNVQVYVSVNKGPEIPAFSQEFPQGSLLWKAPKASGVHKLPRSSGLYRYLLKSGGVTLAITDVYSP